MSDHVVGLRRAVERPIRVAKIAAASAAAIVVIGGVALVATRVRHRRNGKELRARLDAAARAAAAAPQQAKETAAQATKRVKVDARANLKKELGRKRPLHERVLENAARAAATAAVGVALKSLQDATDRNGKASSTGTRPKK
jgi:hypothetical protein